MVTHAQIANGGSAAMYMELIIDQGGLGAGSDLKPTLKPFLSISTAGKPVPEQHNTLLV